jgi:hypothetical protein
VVSGLRLARRGWHNARAPLWEAMPVICGSVLRWLERGRVWAMGEGSCGTGAERGVKRGKVPWLLPSVMARGDKGGDGGTHGHGANYGQRNRQATRSGTMGAAAWRCAWSRKAAFTHETC